MVLIVFVCEPRQLIRLDIVLYALGHTALILNAAGIESWADGLDAKPHWYTKDLRARDDRIAATVH